MEKILPKLGICSTCNYIKDCTGKKTWKGPVTFCEEFDVHSPHKDVSPSEDKNKVDLLGSKYKDDEDYKGICINCENRKTCALIRPEGGVWHCEEYR